MSRKPSLLRRLFAPAISRGRRFSGDERGVTAVEFAILAVPFFTIIFAIIETAMVFFAGQILDSAVEDASRMIKTGRAQAASYNVDSFRTLVCGYTFNLFDCSKIRIRIKKLDSFSSAEMNPTVQTCDLNTCTWSGNEPYEAGIGRDVIQVSAYYRWPLLLAWPYFSMKNQPDNYRLLAATRAFRNEPFS